MASAKPFRCSWQAYDAKSAADWRGKAQAAEAEGFSAFHLADHYLGPGPAADASHPPQILAAVPAMAMAAEATSTLKIGCRVCCCSYRPAAVLVKEAMTIDFLSGGRLELGLGAGWIEGEYDAIGVPYDDIGRRIDRLEETIEVAKAHRAGGVMNINGEQVQAMGFEGAPRPLSPGWRGVSLPMSPVSIAKPVDGRPPRARPQGPNRSIVKPNDSGRE